jgi:RNA polymerase sigma factor (sigma-70 family)
VEIREVRLAFRGRWCQGHGCVQKKLPLQIKKRKILRVAASILTVMAKTTTADGGPKGSRNGAMTDWAVTLAQHDRWLRTALFARLGERQAVDEVIQEVSLAATSLRTPLGDPARAGAWLYRVAIRQAMLYRRRRGRRQKLLDGYSQSWSEDPPIVPDPLAVLLLEERRKLIRDALLTLSRRDAEILLLKYTEDWSCRELAQHLGVGESCIEARLHRARQRLREAMAKTQAIEVLE